jgi:signal transduction histidine kinase
MAQRMTTVTAQMTGGGSAWPARKRPEKQRRRLPLALAVVSGMVAASASTFIEPKTLALWLACEIAAISLCSSLGQHVLKIAQRHGNTTYLRVKFIAIKFAPNLLLGFPLLRLLEAEADHFTALCEILGFFGVACASQIYDLRAGTKICQKIGTDKAPVDALESLQERLARQDALIAELEKAKLASELARRRAEEANLAKSRFLATMSHELRTPLNAILGFSEVMKTELFGAHLVDCYKEYSADIHSSGHHLLMLINEILDLSRIEAGRFELKEEAIFLPTLIEDCRHLLDLRAGARGIKIMEAIEPDLAQVFADARAIRQVALNLLSNAIKFTPVGGKIEIKIGWTVGGGQYFSLCDNGPGIPEEEIPHVLSSFGRGKQAKMNEEEGTGLGLAIVKGLVELHGGKFTLRSKCGEGTKVIVILPHERVLHCRLEKEKPSPTAQQPQPQSQARAQLA